MTEAVEQTPTFKARWRSASDSFSDAALIAAVRRGETAAYGVLYERHLGAAKRASTCLAATAAEREDLVAEAFTRVLRALRRGLGPTEEFRPYLLVTLRNIAIAVTRRGSRVTPYADDTCLRAASDDQVTARSYATVAANAFAKLPERWRIVLWHTEIEGESPAAIAPLLGLTPNGVSALAYRAREGLRQEYLRLHLPAADRRDCRAATDKLAGMVRRSVSPTQLRKINAHLDHCARCRELAAHLAEVNGELQAVLGPLLLGAPVAAAITAVSNSGLTTASCLSAVKATLTAAAVAATTITAVASAPVTFRDTGTANSAAAPAHGTVSLLPRWRSAGLIDARARPTPRGPAGPTAVPVFPMRTHPGDDSLALRHRAPKDRAPKDWAPKDTVDADRPNGSRSPGKVADDRLVGGKRAEKPQPSEVDAKVPSQERTEHDRPSHPDRPST